MNYFQVAGLLVEGGPRDGDAGIRDQFLTAQQVLGMVGGGGEPSAATPASLAGTPFFNGEVMYGESTVSAFRDDMKKFM